jgi:gelsolin
MINPIMQSNPMNLTLHSRGNRSSIGSHSVIQQSSSMENPKQTYSYEQLKMSSGSSFPSEIDISKREMYLSDEEFKELFNMNKVEFSKLPEWRKKRLKQDLNLW